jgi:FeS assembly protein IscX
MDVNPQPNKLYWDSSYAIALCLMEVYPVIDLDTVGMDQLFHMVVKLPNFADDPALVNDGILNEILREWYEEASSR